MIIKNSEEEDKFIAELIEAIKNINTNHINNKESLEIAVQEFAVLECMTSKQRLKIKSSVTDANNCLNGIFPFFNILSPEFSLGSRIIDIFHSCFSFFHANCESKERKNAHIYKLDEYIIHASTDPKTVIIISDTSIKNNIATSISHVYSLSNPIKTMLHHAINVMTTEAELFTIRYRINQTVQILGVAHIIVITDTIHTAHCIFDSSTHPYQLQSIAILKELREFFNKDLSNSIIF